MHDERTQITELFENVEKDKDFCYLSILTSGKCEVKSKLEFDNIIPTCSVFYGLITTTNF